MLETQLCIPLVNPIFSENYDIFNVLIHFSQNQEIDSPTLYFDLYVKEMSNILSDLMYTLLEIYQSYNIFVQAKLTISEGSCEVCWSFRALRTQRKIFILFCSARYVVY